MNANTPRAHDRRRRMNVEGGEGVIIVATTDVHLARRIGDAVHAAHSGDPAVKYSPDEYLVRVSWKR